MDRRGDKQRKRCTASHPDNQTVSTDGGPDPGPCLAARGQCLHTVRAGQRGGPQAQCSGPGTVSRRGIGSLSINSRLVPPCWTAPADLPRHCTYPYNWPHTDHVDQASDQAEFTSTWQLSRQGLQGPDC